MRSKLSKYFEGISATETLANFMSKNCSSPSCAFLIKWTKVTKGNLEYQGPLLGTFEILKHNFLKTKLDYIIKKFSELHGMLTSVGILRLSNIQFSSVQSLSHVRLFATP